jgi:hypothetical protein
MRKSLLILTILILCVALYFFVRPKLTKNKSKSVVSIHTPKVFDFEKNVKNYEVRSKSFVGGFKIVEDYSFRGYSEFVRLTKKEYLDTVIHSDVLNSDIPLLSYEELEKRLGMSANSIKNILAVVFDDHSDFELSSAYEKKIRLNELMPSLSTNYILFVNIDDVLINIINKHNLKKYLIPIYIFDNALNYLSLKREAFVDRDHIIYAKNLLSKDWERLQDRIVVKNVYNDKKFETKSLSTIWSFHVPYFNYPQYSIGRMKSVGFQRDIFIPSPAFKTQIEKEYGVDQNFTGCLFQIKSSELLKIQNINFYSNEVDQLQKEYFDNGNFIREKLDLFEILFVKVENPGVLSLEFDERNSLRTLNIPCNEGQYFLVN